MEMVMGFWLEIGNVRLYEIDGFWCRAVQGWRSRSGEVWADLGIHAGGADYISFWLH